MTFSLHPQLAADTTPVCKLELSDLVLMNDSRYLWCILVPRLDGLRDLHEVPQANKAQLLEEVDRVSLALQELSGAYKMNVAALGNMVEQLHVHVIARHQGDAAWPGPVWGVGSAEPYDESAAQTLVQQLREKLGA